MRRLIIAGALPLLFSLTACEGQNAVSQGCTGIGGTANFVRENRLKNEFTLVHTAPDGKVTKYKLKPNATFGKDEILVGSNDIWRACETGTVGERWVRKLG